MHMPMIRRLAVLGLGCLLGGFGPLMLCGSAAGDIYRYVDAAGVVHFTNIPTTVAFHLYRKEEGPASSLAETIRRFAALYDLEEALVRAVIKAESDFDPLTVSAKGAVGLMQLLPQTAREIGIEDLRRPEENIRGGCRYLRQLLDSFGGDLDLALAAYNAGPGAVRRHGGIPPFPETQNYVRKVKEFLRLFRRQKDA